MQFWALIVDSFRASLDRKIFWVILLISLVVAGGMFCIAFEPRGINVLFGTWVITTDAFTVGGEVRPDFIASVATEWIMDNILGWLAVILALIATADFLPTLMQPGVIEVAVSKPLPRWQLFLGKYIGSLMFFFVHAVIFVGLTFLVLGFRWGAWIPAYLLSIPLTVLLFSYLYCVSALVAVITRSTITAILLALGAWVAFAGVQLLGDTMEMYPQWQESRALYRGVQVARWAVPKTQDLTLLARKWTAAASPFDMVGTAEKPEDQDMMERARQAEQKRLALSPISLIGSSLLFEAFIVVLAMWRFSRLDF